MLKPNPKLERERKIQVIKKPFFEKWVRSIGRAMDLERDQSKRKKSGGSFGHDREGIERDDEEKDEEEGAPSLVLDFAS